MSPRKYGTDSWGAWERDETNLPFYELVPHRVPLGLPPLRHVLGTGRLSLLADHHGVMQCFTYEPGFACCFGVPGPGFCSGLYLRLAASGSDSAALFPVDACRAESTLMRWGVGYVRYQDEIEPKPGCRVRVVLDVLAPVDETFFLISLRLENRTAEKLELRLQLLADISPAPVAAMQQRRPVFLKEGLAVFGDLHPRIGDFFLAGDTAWKSGATSSTLSLTAELAVEPEKDCSASALMGFSPRCSVDWLRGKLGAHTPESVRAKWAELSGRRRVRTPELWMQEECLWDAGQTLAFRSVVRESLPAVVCPGGGAAFGLGMVPERQWPAPATRDILLLSLPFCGSAPDQALANLRAVSVCQSANGRVPEGLGDSGKADVDAARDRSDLELWYLVAWAQYLQANPDPKVLDGMCPFANGPEAPLLEHVRLAYQWIRDEIRQGPHGLLRILAGDWNGYLSRVGAGGKGESVLNSVLACYATTTLIEVLRRRDHVRLAEEMTAWAQELRLAVGEAFDGKQFRRAYTDAGRPVGSLVEDRVFVDVQAWAVLAKCGTARQREMALDTVRETCGAGPAVTVMSRPYPVPPPDDVSDQVLPPGDGCNAGVSVPVAAWFVWALAGEGRTEPALREWERLAVRRRAGESGELSAAVVAGRPFCASGFAGRRVGGWALDELRSGLWLPSAQAVAWQEFVLHRITA